MKTWMRLGAVLCVVLGCGIAAQAADTGTTPGAPAAKKAAAWQDFRSKEAGFGILMPGKAELTTQPLDGGGVIISYEVDLGESYYSVSYNELASGWRQRTTDDQMLDRSRDGAVNAVKGKLRSERKFNLGNVRGRDLVYDTPDNLTLEQRHYTYADRLFQVTYVGPLNSESKAEIKRFFESFRFIQ